MSTAEPYVKPYLKIPESGVLTARQIYEFDTRGYITIRNFLSADTVSRMNELIDAHHKAKSAAPQLFPVLPIHRLFWELMTNRKVLDMACWWCGGRFRVDHIYGLQRPAAGTPGENGGENLHGGAKRNMDMFQYHWMGDRSRVGLLVFGFAMETANVGDGGLMVVPGSHKNTTGFEGREVWDLVEHSHDNSLCVQPVLAAGDLIVFPETLVHGPKRWQNRAHRRRILYYKYCPSHLCWRDYSQWAGPMQQQAQTEVERGLLTGPFVARYEEDAVGMSASNQWREETKLG